MVSYFCKNCNGLNEKCRVDINFRGKDVFVDKFSKNKDC